MEFDPAYWQKLAQDDPHAFECARLEAIETLIAAAPLDIQDRLRGLQCRIDLERRKARTPMGAALRLQSLMWDRFESLRAVLNDVGDPDSNGLTPEATRRPSARIIPFQRAREQDAGDAAGSRLSPG